MVSEWSRMIALKGASLKEEDDVAEDHHRPAKATRKKGATLKTEKIKSKSRLEKLRRNAENRSK